MDQLFELQVAIETLREQLHALVSAKNGNLADREVTWMSEELDKLIVRHDKLKADAEAGKKR